MQHTALHQHGAHHNRRIGYARGTTTGQSPEVDALYHAGCDSIHTDTTSGIMTAGLGLTQALASLQLGNPLVVSRCDRVARMPHDQHRIVAAIQATGAHCTILTERQEVLLSNSYNLESIRP